MASELKGKRIAILAADMVERVEFDRPRDALRKAGAEVELVSIHDGEIKAFDHFDPAGTISVDRTVEEASADEYDALYVPGGVGNPDQLRGDENAVRFVQDFFAAGKPVGAMCHAPWIVVEAGAARGRRIAAWHTLETDIRNAGGEFVEEPVVESGGLLTSRKPDDLDAYVPALIEHFAQARVESQKIHPGATPA